MSTVPTRISVASAPRPQVSSEMILAAALAASAKAWGGAELERESALESHRASPRRTYAERQSRPGPR